jgi:hypothetical protein
MVVQPPKGVNKVFYSPDDLKTLVEALNAAPSYLSKRFILKNLCGWSEDMLTENTRLKTEENEQINIGNKAWR